MEGSTGGSGGHTGRRRTSLLDHISMSAIDNRRIGLTMGAVLKLENRASAEMGPTVTEVNRTLLDIIRNEEPHISSFGHKDNKSWKAFRDRLRFKRAGAAWNSLVPVPVADILVNNNNVSRSFMSRRNSVRFTTVSDQNHRGNGDDISNVSSSSGPYVTHRSSGRFAAAPNFPEENTGEPNIHTVVDDPVSRSFGSQLSGNRSIRLQASENEEDTTRRLGEERVLSAREEGGREEGEPVRMSLMDLLEETDIDRQMGFEVSRYVVGTYEDDDDGKEVVRGVEGEVTCCVCMVRQKGAAFIPCGHTFCRLCSREIWVQRGKCPLCNGFILEILDIF